MIIWKFSKSDTTEGDVDVTLLGGKGAGLVRMARQGLPVPPGFVIPTEFCSQATVKPEVLHNLAMSADHTVRHWMAPNLQFTDTHYPLVSVRSGARVSMPGMMDTILNVGITSATMEFWQKKLGVRGALDCYRRLIQMYGSTVKGIDHKRFASALKETMASKYGYPKVPASEAQMSVKHLEKLIEKYKIVYTTATNEAFPDTLYDQLEGAIGAVFKSWNSERTKAYRKEHKIPDDWDTAVVIQAMVFGNLNDQSCSGVLFSRDASTGSKGVMGEFLPNAQGEEVVSGTATPQNLGHMHNWNLAVFKELMAVTAQLEDHYKDMVDIEFTVENGKLFILQVRTGKRSAPAAFKIAYDLVAEGVISKEVALKRVSVGQYKSLSKAVIDPKFKDQPIATGLAGSKGIATGRVWFSAAKAQKNPGGILVSKETNPDDFAGMAASVGILTATGGITSHAAVVARGMDRACVVGCTEIKFNLPTNVVIGINLVGEGDVITIEGDTGRVWYGTVPMTGGTVPAYVFEMMQWGLKPGELLKFDPKPASLPEAGVIHIDCSKLSSEAEAAVLMAHLVTRPKLSGVLSFVTTKASFDDSQFLKVLSVAAAPQVDVKIVEALLSETTPVLLQNWVVVPGCVVKKHKYRTPTRLIKLKDLLSCDGYFEETPEFVATLKSEGVELKDLLTLMQQAGKSVTPVATPQSVDELALAVLSCS